MIRAITVDDVPWGMSLAHRRYEEFDPGGALIAIGQAIRSPNALAVRSDHGFLVAHIVASGWFPRKREAYVLWLCVEEGHHWEAVRLLRASVGWAKEQGCTRWWFDSETEHEVAALAERVGAHEVPRYTVDLTEGCR